MHATTLLLTSALALTLTACAVDGSSSPGTDPLPTCAPKVAPDFGEEHNPGLDCASCHSSEFAIAGTLYTAARHGTPLGAGTITVTDADGATFTTLTTKGGNFYIHDDAAKPINFPITVNVSQCPDVAVMHAPIPYGRGSCNQFGCHDSLAQGNVYF